MTAVPDLTPARDEWAPARSLAPLRPRGESIPPQGVGGYDQCWYPVGLSEEFPSGKATGADFLNGRVIVFRDSSGKASALSAYCRHLGADLSLGSVEGRTLSCSFHGWQYDTDGICTKIPAGNPVPEGTRLFRFPTVERFGLVWAFNGEEALFEPPGFPGKDIEALAYRVVRLPDFPSDPFVLVSNCVDFQHLLHLHEMEFALDTRGLTFDHYSVQYESYPAGTPEEDIDQTAFRVRILGTNVFALDGRGPNGYMATLAPQAPKRDGGSRSYGITIVEKGEDEDGRIQMTSAMFASIYEEDFEVQELLRFRSDTLVAADEVLSRYFDYARRFPRSAASSEFLV